MRKTNFILLPFFLCSLLTVSSTRTFSQDAHYWSSAYGPAGYFVPGASISHNRDSGVLFYNPALLATTTQVSSSISGNVYQWNTILLKNGAGQGLDLRSRSTQIVPLVASHAVPYLKNKWPVTLAYAIVHTPIIHYRTSQRKDVIQDVLDNSYSPGPETYLGIFSAENQMEQTSFQLAAGIKLNRQLSAGLTLEGITHRQNFTQDVNAKALVNASGNPTFPPISGVSQTYSASYRHAALRVRLGLAYDLSPEHHFGLLLITPGWRIAGKGTILANTEISNLQTGSVPFNLLANTRQTGLKARWKDPFNITAGYSWFRDKVQLYLCTGYYAKVSEYNVLIPGSGVFVRPDSLSSGNISFLKMKDARQAVFNAGFAVGYSFTSSFTMIASFRTDFNYADTSLFADEEGYQPNISSWNMYHAQIGANLQHKKHHVRAGLLFSYGSTSQQKQAVNFDNPHEENFLVGDVQPVKAHSIQTGVVVSYIHHF